MIIERLFIFVLPHTTQKVKRKMKKPLVNRQDVWVPITNSILLSNTLPAAHQSVRKFYINDTSFSRTTNSNHFRDLTKMDMIFIFWFSISILYIFLIRILYSLSLPPKLCRQQPHILFHRKGSMVQRIRRRRNRKRIQRQMPARLIISRIRNHIQPFPVEKSH